MYHTRSTTGALLTTGVCQCNRPSAGTTGHDPARISCNRPNRLQLVPAPVLALHRMYRYRLLSHQSVVPVPVTAQIFFRSATDRLNGSATHYLCIICLGCSCTCSVMLHALYKLCTSVVVITASQSGPLPVQHAVACHSERTCSEVPYTR
jgi:hypothetical protein